MSVRTLLAILLLGSPETIYSSLPCHKIAFGSCNNARKAGLWETIERQSHPNEMILLGDNHYADHKDKWQRFIGSNSSNLKHQYDLLESNTDFQNLLSSMGGLSSLRATFDDHDFGINNGDRTYPLRNFSQSCFWDFMKEAPDSRRRLQQAVYTSKTVSLPYTTTSRNFTYKTVLLDSRSNKDPLGTFDGDFLGEEQWQWLADELADPLPDLIILGSSIQVLPQDKILEETWDEFPAARQRLLNLVGLKTAAPNIILLSGDVHTGEVLQAKCRFDYSDGSNKHSVQKRGDFRLYEFTSSGLSHTFSKTTRKQHEHALAKAESTLPEGQLVEEVSRGILYEAAYDMYVATGVSQSREFHYGDHYKGLHYGLIEFYLSEEKNTTVKVSIIDNKGQTVMLRNLPMVSHEEKRQAHLDPDYSSATSVNCEPYWGRVPKWRVYLARLSLLLIPFIFLCLPVLSLAFIIVKLLLSITSNTTLFDAATKLEAKRK